MGDFVALEISERAQAWGIDFRQFLKKLSLLSPLEAAYCIDVLERIHTTIGRATDRAMAYEQIDELCHRFKLI